MFSLTPSEILTIGIVALIVFGPRRLPELARRAGKMLGYLRTVASDLRREIEGDIDAVAKPIRDAADELSAEGKAIKDAAAGDLEAITKPFREAATELSAEGKALRETAEGELKWVDEEPT